MIISLTRSSEGKDCSFLVNLDYIISIEDYEGGSVLIFSKLAENMGGGVIVKESREEIFCLIERMITIHRGKR